MAFLAAIPAAIGGAVGGSGSLLGTVASIAGTALSGFAAYGAAKYQQQVGEMNAKIAQENATRARERSRIAQEEQDDQTRAMLGAQEAAQSASGLSLTGRSQMLTRKAARQLGRKDALNVIQAGNIESYNYQVDAANQQASANLAGSQATGSLLGSFLNIGTTLIGSAQSTAKSSKYDPWRTKTTNLRYA